MAESRQKDVQILEQGNIYFFYRPKVDEPSVEGLEDLERFYMVLEPKRKDEHLYRLIVIGHKKMPEIKPHGGGNGYWGFVDKVSQKAEEIEDELGINLQPQNEKDALDAIVNDLHLELSQHPMAPLLKGQWQ